MADFAIIGAGLAGLACARRLRATGADVRLFDAEAGPGGRMASRTEGLVGFDHGAQYFTVRDREFGALIDAAAEAGCAARWKPRWPGGEPETQDLWVGVPTMSALLEWLAAGLDIVQDCRIHGAARGERGWIVTDDQGTEHGAHDALVLAVPAPQAAALAATRTRLAGRLRQVPMAPCWTAMATFEEPVAVAFDVRFDDDPVLPWFARNSSKPGRSGPDAWVLHAGADWSRQRAGARGGAVIGELLARLGQRLGAPLPRSTATAAHFWECARVEAPLGEAYLEDPAASIGCCGDWCIDARVEAAWLSGDALGRRLASGRAG